MQSEPVADRNFVTDKSKSQIFNNNTEENTTKREKTRMSLRMWRTRNGCHWRKRRAAPLGGEVGCAVGLVV